MMSNPIFSIIIPTYNRPHILTKTLECIENQKTDIKYEVIVIDDGSSESFERQNFGTDKRVDWKYLRNEKNMGRAATRNKGINDSRGKYILMLDDDIQAVPILLQVHFEAQQKIGGGVVVGAVPPSQEIQKNVWNDYISMRYKRIHKRLQNNKLDYGLFFTGNVSIPLKLLKEAGGFNEEFKEYSFEDTELGYKLYRMGIPFYHEPNAIGYHLFDESLESLCRKAYELGRSSYLFVKLHPEVKKDIQYHSITLGPWHGKEGLKNLVKFILYNNFSCRIIKWLTEKVAKIGLKRLSFFFLSCLELQYRALGAKDARIADQE